MVAQVGSDSYLFLDNDPATGTTDGVIFLQGITLAGIAAGDIIA